MSSWRKRWRASPTSLSNARTTTRSQSHSTVFQPVSVTRIRGNPPTKDMCYRSSHRIHSKPSRWNNTTLRWGSPSTKSSRLQGPAVGKAPKANPIWSHTPWSGRILSYHDSKRQQTIHCRSLWKYLEEVVRQGFLKEYILTPRAASNVRQPCASPPAIRNTWSPSIRRLSALIPSMEVGKYLHQ